MDKISQSYRTLIEYGIPKHPDQVGRPVMCRQDKAQVRPFLKSKDMEMVENCAVVTEKGFETCRTIARLNGYLTPKVYQFMLSKMEEAYQETLKNVQDTTGEEYRRWEWQFCWPYYLMEWSPSLTPALYSRDMDINYEVATSSPEEIIITAHGMLYDGRLMEGDCIALLSPHYDKGAKASISLALTLEKYQDEIQKILEMEDNVIPQKFTGPKSLL